MDYLQTTIQDQLKRQQNISYMELLKRLEQVQFGYYCSSEIRKLSVSEITQPMAFDQLQRPLKKGLYDPALGVSPYDKFNRCQTCQQEGINCQGHLGHIELLLPLYNPFLITQFMKLLKTMCFKCHRLRINSNLIVHYYYQILLIKMGYIQQAIQYSQAVNNKYFKNSKTKNTVQVNQNESTNYESESNQTNNKDPQKQIQNIIKDCLREKQQALDKLEVKNNADEFEVPHLDTQQIQRALKDKVVEFYQNVNLMVCPHCQEKAHQIKKEGFTKIFYVNKAKQQKEDDQEQESSNKQMYMNPIEIREHLKKLWIREKKILSLMFGNVVINKETLKSGKGYKIMSNDYNMFFIEVVAVTPNRFRPENKMDDQTFLHSHTIQLTKIININNDLKNLLLKKENEQTVKKDNLELKEEQQLLEMNKLNELKLQDVISKWLELQDTLNVLYDSSKGGKKEDNSGIRQLFEKKQGLFRMKMMGKRVNFTARSVISPDPYLDTNEVGVPLYFAKRLTFPEGVNEYNIEELRKMVINGPHVWPGANSIECEGLKISLDTRSQQERVALANQLSQNMKNKVVLRHLKNGDPLMFNRQPTLHKPNLMSHLARVLQKENTIRMHYANCSSYNADFDGDEMNLHLVQNYIAKSETKYLSLNDHQYIVAKNGAPIRGLIQDSVLAASWLTSKDTVFDRDQFQQLLYVSLEKVLTIRDRVKIPKPCIIKPIQRYSGKQLISCILQSLVEIELQQEKDQQKGMYMDKASKISKDVFGKNGQDESLLYIMDNELIHGIIDKNQIGATEFGMVHSFYELYGPKLTSILLTSLAKLFTSYLQYNGFSCGMEDLFLNKQSDIERIQLIKQAHRKGVEAQAAFVNIDYKCSEQFNLFNRPSLELSNDKNIKEVFKRKADTDYISVDNELIYSLSKKLNDVNQPEILAGLDHIVKQNLGNTTTEIFKLTNNGLRLQYPSNKFQSMVLTGAKGSTVNQNQISVMLGQQELEGKRVPITVTGRSLPSFIQYDPNPRAGGYISDRFLTGLRPQEFYFHCMAGREGLIDTAVKTSRSGYLQRCLVKHLENLKVEYDYSVRDSDGSIFQFQYGEDGIDTQKNKFLQKYSFIQNNYNAYINKYQPKNLSSILDSKQVKQYLKKRQQNPQEYQYDTILNNFYPGSHLGATSEKANQQINQYIKENKPDNWKKLQSLFNIKYFYSLVQPGESVGPIAAQSIGEPSTQMTLNTFHLAGHGAANVTLGIPRLREILMTAAKTIKTPCMYLAFKDEEIRNDKEKAEMYKQKLQKIVLVELVRQIRIKEIKVLANDNELTCFGRHRQITVKLEFENVKAIEFAFGINLERIQKVVEVKFVGILLMMVHKQLKKEKSIDQNLIKIATIQEKDKDKDKEKENQDFEQTIEEEDNEDEKSNNSEEPKLNKKEKQDKKGQEVGEKYQFLSKQMMEYFIGVNHGQDYSVIQLKVPLNCKQLLMINLVEQALEQTIVNEIKGINNCFVVKDKQKGYILQTEGVNFEKVWKQTFIDQNRIETNDIQANINYYGIEAGRQSIINEINRVFGVYHISVDYRHLAIIADYMTFLGSMRALNRIGINDHPSTFMKMSFETTMKFLCESTMQRDIDTGKSPSSSIVLGRVPRLGTGVFDIRHKFK